MTNVGSGPWREIVVTETALGCTKGYQEGLGMRTRLVMGMVAGTAALSMGGCYFDFDSFDGYDEPPPPSARAGFDGYGGVEQALEVRNGAIAGSMGDVEGFSGGVFLEEGWGYEGYSSVQLQAQDRSAGWATMAQLEVDGGLSGLEEGRVYQFEGYANYDESGIIGGARAHVRVLGCSGPAAGTWEFDTYADDVQVRLTPGSEAGFQRVDYRAHFSGSSSGATTQEVWGSFEVAVQ